jgi:tetratricopeptide (TPR) repeat protein
VQSHEIRLNYQQATQLVQVGRYEEAMEILLELNEAKPNTENILYLMTVCHAKAGNKKETLILCERLAKDFDHEYAKKMLKRLNKDSSPLGTEKSQSVSATDQPSVSSSAAEENVSAQPADAEEEKSDSDTADVLDTPEIKDDSGIEGVEESGDATPPDESAGEDSKEPSEQNMAQEAEQNAASDSPTTIPAEAPAVVAVRVSRPLWLVLLWSALLALIVAYVLYVYVLDPVLHPF